jgi:hypothetical protein
VKANRPTWTLNEFVSPLTGVNIDLGRREWHAFREFNLHLLPLPRPALRSGLVNPSDPILAVNLETAV